MLHNCNNSNIASCVTFSEIKKKKKEKKLIHLHSSTFA